MLPEAVPDRIGLVLGPEGGLSAEDLHLLERAGGVRAGLGRQILRAETAAVVAPALVMWRYGTLG